MAKRGNTTKLADSFIRKLAPPAAGNKVYYDSDVAGFGIRVTAGSVKSFILNYRTTAGRERRFTIGGWPTWTATDARAEARRLRRLIDAGGDPLADIEAEREAATMAQLCDRFEAEHLPRKRPSTQEAYLAILEKYVRPYFGGHTKVQDVVFSDIDRLHRKITTAGSPYSANRTVAVVHKIFDLAIRWQMRSGDNPCRGVERNLEEKRKRYLAGDELPRLCSALAAHRDQQAADIIRILLLTGCRRGEALAMRWSDVDLGDNGKWSKPAASTKQKQDHIAPLSAPAKLLLSKIREQQTNRNKTLGEFVFPADSGSGHRASIKRTWDQLLRAAKIEGLRLHDLRHSFASEVVSGGGSLPLTGALLGHSNVASTARYAHLHADPMRDAVERVGRVIEAAANAGRPKAPVIALGRRPRHGR